MSVAPNTKVPIASTSAPVSRNTISMTDPYWQPGPLFSMNEIRTLNPLYRDLGFRNEIPVPLPIITAGGSYYGSNESELSLPKKLVFSGQAEYFAPGGYIRSNDGMPAVNIYNPEFNYERAANSKWV